ncbi:MAG TPA: HdeA/HdeB family chaperone, partial [Rubellimicrobium sp.]|nr:HdeA/HdeB family chaperone [Rubellimicrobium sp.]
MKTFFPVIVIAAAVAGPTLAQDASGDAAGRLDAMTCREFMAFAPEDQMTMMLAMRAHVNGDPLPDEPLPVGAEAEVGGADGLGGDSGDPGTAANADATDAGASEASGGTEDVTASTEAAEGTEVEDTVAAAAGE